MTGPNSQTPADKEEEVKVLVRTPTPITGHKIEDEETRLQKIMEEMVKSLVADTIGKKRKDESHPTVITKDVIYL